MDKAAAAAAYLGRNSLSIRKKLLTITVLKLKKNCLSDAYLMKYKTMPTVSTRFD